MSYKKRDLFLSAIKNREVSILIEDSTTIRVVCTKGEKSLDYYDIETTKPVRIL
jgi:hypothetical protein